MAIAPWLHGLDTVGIMQAATHMALQRHAEERAAAHALEQLTLQREQLAEQKRQHDAQLGLGYAQLNQRAAGQALQSNDRNRGFDQRGNTAANNLGLGYDRLAATREAAAARQAASRALEEGRNARFGRTQSERERRNAFAKSQSVKNMTLKEAAQRFKIDQATLQANARKLIHVGDQLVWNNGDGTVSLIPIPGSAKKMSQADLMAFGMEKLQYSKLMDRIGKMGIVAPQTLKDEAQAHLNNAINILKPYQPTGTISAPGANSVVAPAADALPTPLGNPAFQFDTGFPINEQDLRYAPPGTRNVFDQNGIGSSFAPEIPNFWGQQPGSLTPPDTRGGDAANLPTFDFGAENNPTPWTDLGQVTNDTGEAFPASAALSQPYQDAFPGEYWQEGDIGLNPPPPEDFQTPQFDNSQAFPGTQARYVWNPETGELEPQ